MPVDLGDYASIPDTGQASDLGDYAAIPDTGTTSDLGDYASLPEAKTLAPKTAAAVEELKAPVPSPVVKPPEGEVLRGTSLGAGAYGRFRDLLSRITQPVQPLSAQLEHGATGQESLIGTTKQYPLSGDKSLKEFALATINAGNRAMAGATSLETIESLPFFSLPGAAEGYIANVVTTLPDQYKEVKAEYNKSGLSPQFFQTAAQNGLNDVMAALPFVFRESVKEPTSIDAMRKRLQGGETDAQRPDTQTGAIPVKQGEPVVSGPEGTVKEGDTRPPSAEKPAQKITPNDLVPALIDSGGTEIVGLRGQTHEDIINAQPDPRALRADDPLHGFKNENTGEFLTRRQASDALGIEEELHSERLRELQKEAPVTQRFEAPVGAEVPDEAATTANLTRAALDWRQNLVNEATQLGQQADLLQQMGQPLPKPLADRMEQIHAELQRGFQPPVVQPYQPEGGGVSEKAKTIGEPDSQQAAPDSNQIQTERQRQETVAEGGQATAPPPEEGLTTGPSNRVQKEMAARGQIEPVQTGWGKSTEDMKDWGHSLLRQGVDPNETAARVRATGAQSDADMAVVVAHGDNLARAAAAAERVADAAPKSAKAQADYGKAMDDLNGWLQNVQQPMKTAWSNMGRGLQGEEVIDTDSLTGIRKAVMENRGADLSPEEQTKFKEVARVSQKSATEAADAIRTASEQVEKKMRRKGSKPRTPEELRQHFEQRIRELTPCNL